MGTRGTPDLASSCFIMAGLSSRFFLEIEFFLQCLRNWCKLGSSASIQESSSVECCRLINNR